jgi:cell division protein ZapE
VLDLPTLLRGLPARPGTAELLASFVPPPRFAAKGFADYAPDPRHPSQERAVARLRVLADEMNEEASAGWKRRLLSALGRLPRGSGVYLDGGFGVGKTHLLAALWNAAPGPKAYLSFDELVYTIGLLGVEATRQAFGGLRLVAVDEWELDDPGNLKLAMAFLRGAVDAGVRVATTSNTIPDDLGRGRFDQKRFATEIEELSAVFETVGIEGEDFRHRRFQADPGRAYFVSPAEMAAREAAAGERTLAADFRALVAALGEVHPIRYAALVERIGGLLVRGVGELAHLYDALRWVHFVDKLYDADVPLAATSEVALGALFPRSFLAGAYGKKFSRCLSRMEEMLGESAASAEPEEAGGGEMEEGRRAAG